MGTQIFVRSILFISSVYLVSINETNTTIIGVLLFLFAFTFRDVAFLFEIPRELVKPKTSVAGRRLLYWFISGWIFFALFLFYVIVRATVVEGFSLGLPVLQKYSQGTPFFALVYLAAITSAIPVGYMIYQFYYSIYWYFNPPWRFTKIDRSYEILSRVGKELNLDFSTLAFNGKGLESNEIQYEEYDIGRIWFGATPYKKPANIDNVLEKARKNWWLLSYIWHEATKEEKYYTIQVFAGVKEDNFTLMGAGRLASILAYSFYFVYETVRLYGGLINISLYSWSIILSAIISFCIFWMFNASRSQLDDDTMAFKLNHLRHVLSKPKQNIVPHKEKIARKARGVAGA